MGFNGKHYLFCHFFLLFIIPLFFPSYFSFSSPSIDSFLPSHRQLELASEFECDLRDTVDWGKKWLVDFNTGKLNLLCLIGQVTLVALM